ncbi:MAG: hypothetical protein ABSH34_26125, partial [Verrucomicrobiota bacterium]
MLRPAIKIWRGARARSGATPFPNASEPDGLPPTLLLALDRARTAEIRNCRRILCAFAPRRLLWIL